MNEDFETREIWEKAKNLYLSTLQSEDEKNQIGRYLSMITSVSKKGKTFLVYMSSSYAAELLKERYHESFKKCIELISPGQEIMLDFLFDETTRPSIVIQNSLHNQNQTPKEQKTSTFVSTMPLNDEYTFEEFVRGPSNSFALAAAQAVVANPGRSSYNPLFIHGGTGLGKTHLMQAIGNKLKEKNSSLAICYLTAEEYMNEYVNYLKDDKIHAFRTKYRTVDILLIDDVQFLQRGKNIQEEFFNTFNALQQANKQIVMTSDVAPKNLPALESRLISRFEGGMLQEIESPSYETRLAILKKKAESQNLNISLTALEFIADNIKSHVRAMEGALGKISVYINAYPNTLLTNEILTRILNDLLTKEQSLKKLSVDEIQAAVAKKYGVSITQILSAERTQSIVTPRQLAMYISRKFTTNSLPEIAKQFEKTHATIIHGIKNIQKRLDVEEDLKSIMAEILSQFGYNLSDKMD